MGDWIELKNASCISFPLFGFANDLDGNLYVHCAIYICTEDSGECEPSTCPASTGGRKRRHADANTMMKTKSADGVHVVVKDAFISKDPETGVTLYTKTRQSGLDVIGQMGDPQKISSAAMPIITIFPIVLSILMLN